MRRRTVAAVTSILVLAELCSAPSGLAAAESDNETPVSPGTVLGN